MTREMIEQYEISVILPAVLSGLSQGNNPIEASLMINGVWHDVRRVQNQTLVFRDGILVATPGTESPASGLSDEQIQQLPTGQISKEQEEENNTCSVCLMPYKEGETVSKLPCNHSYHFGCIQTWLKEHATCPYCRSKVAVE